MSLSNAVALPRIEENLTMDSKSAKQRVTEILDMLEGHVEKLRKEACKLEEEKDTLLATLDSVRNADLMVDLVDCKYLYLRKI